MGKEENNEINKQISIAIKPINYDENKYDVKLDQDKVTLNLSGNLENMNLQNIRCYIDLASLKKEIIIYL